MNWTPLIFKCKYCQKLENSQKFPAMNEFPLPFSIYIYWNIYTLSIHMENHAGLISSRLWLLSNKPVPRQAHCEASQELPFSSPQQGKHTRPTNSRFWPKHGQKLAGNSPLIPLKLSIGPRESYQPVTGRWPLLSWWKLPRTIDHDLVSLKELAEI